MFVSYVRFLSTPIPDMTVGALLNLILIGMIIVLLWSRRNYR